MNIAIQRLKEKDFKIAEYIAMHLIDNPDPERPLSHLKELLRDKRSYLFAAIVNDAIVGYVLAYRFPSLYSRQAMAYVYDIEVNIAYRRMGIGRMLMQSLMADLAQDGVGEAWLGTGIDNIAAHALYKAVGGVPSGEVFHDYTFSLSPKTPKTI